MYTCTHLEPKKERMIYTSKLLKCTYAYPSVHYCQSCISLPFSCSLWVQYFLRHFWQTLRECVSKQHLQQRTKSLKGQTVYPLNYMTSYRMQMSATKTHGCKVKGSYLKFLQNTHSDMFLVPWKYFLRSPLRLSNVKQEYPHSGPQYRTWKVMWRKRWTFILAKSKPNSERKLKIFLNTKCSSYIIALQFTHINMHAQSLWQHMQALHT